MKIAVLGGDGIGPEVTRQSLKILEFFRSTGLPIELEHADVGGCAYDRTGHPLPPDTLALAKAADAILFGAEGGFQYETLPRGLRPGDALLTLRLELGLFANFRPVRVMKPTIAVSPFRRDVILDVDMLILRELNSDIYFGEPRGIRERDGQREGLNTMYYNEEQVRRIARVGFETAMARRKRLCSVDKANVLESMELWRTIVDEVSRDYPDVELTHLYVDAAAMTLIKSPSSFDVLLTTNLFGDILSDEASMIPGSIGMLPSASMGRNKKGLFEPVHGCAPDIAGKDLANPLASILSTAMMFRQSFEQHEAADATEAAVLAALEAGYRTNDIYEDGMIAVGTQQMGDLVLVALQEMI